MWSGLIGLFLKIEQNNLYNEINFNLTTLDPRMSRRAAGRSTGSSAPRIVARLPCRTGPARHLSPGPSDYRGNMAAGQVIPVSGSNCPAPDRPHRIPSAATTTTECCTRTRRSTWPTSPTGRPRRSSWARAYPDRRLVSGDDRRHPHQHRSHHQPADHFQRATNYWTYWMSKHPQMVNFGFVDGSVRPVTQRNQQDDLEQDHDTQRRRDRFPPTRSSK